MVRGRSGSVTIITAVSHELRTPLGHLRILTDIARERGVTPKTLDEIEAEIYEIDELVGQLLARSRLDLTALSDAPVELASWCPGKTLVP